MTAVRDPALLSSASAWFGRLMLGSEHHPPEFGGEGQWHHWAPPAAAASPVVTTKVAFGKLGDLLPPGRRRGTEHGDSLAWGMDAILTVGLIVFLFPVLVAVALLVFLADPGPVLFAHKRQGRNGRTFNCLKFRSMVQDADRQLQILLARDSAAREEWERDHKLRDDPRITRVGNFLRRSSLDELPQLFNVLRGEMSLVGPRPIVEAEISRYGRYISHYYRVRPGITGLWQVSGRNNTSYRRRVALDVMYARRKSANLNLRILFMTLPSVLKSRGAF